MYFGLALIIFSKFPKLLRILNPYYNAIDAWEIVHRSITAKYYIVHNLQIVKLATTSFVARYKNGCFATSRGTGLEPCTS